MGKIMAEDLLIIDVVNMAKQLEYELFLLLNSKRMQMLFKNNQNYLFLLEFVLTVSWILCSKSPYSGH